jgi:hypothetical protein
LKANGSDQSITLLLHPDFGRNAVKTDLYGMPSMLAAEDVVKQIAAHCDFVGDRAPSEFGRSAGDRRQNRRAIPQRRRPSTFLISPVRVGRVRLGANG